MNRDEEKITLKNVKIKETGIDRENNLYIKEFLSYLAFEEITVFSEKATLNLEFAIFKSFN